MQRILRQQFLCVVHAAHAKQENNSQNRTLAELIYQNKHTNKTEQIDDKMKLLNRI